MDQMKLVEAIQTRGDVFEKALRRNLGDLSNDPAKSQKMVPETVAKWRTVAHRTPQMRAFPPLFFKKFETSPPPQYSMTR